MPLRHDPQRLRSIEQFIVDLTKTAARLGPTDPRAGKIGAMIRGLQAEGPGGSGTCVTEVGSESRASRGGIGIDRPWRPHLRQKLGQAREPRR
jgi:hypothetical protein